MVNDTSAPPPAKHRCSQERAFIQAVEEGLADADAGRTVAHATVVRRMKARFTQGKRSRTQ